MKIGNYNNLKNVSGAKIKELRQKQNMSQQQLAEKLQLNGISLTAKEISKIELGNRLIQDFELFAFADALNVTTDTFKNSAKTIL